MNQWNECKGGGSNARLGGRELTLLCGFNHDTLLQNRDNSRLLGNPVYYTLNLGGGGHPLPSPPPPPPPVEPPWNGIVEWNTEIYAKRNY